ncbi:ribonuclease HII [Aquisalinus luteolus]|uniref:Ribonuclease HII n=1 Tax=Aquisalinus luteolus TaxID=1566827 RepID=A0A8J3A5A5_9PROT|nr:ribonuclease HII [Aquisalinus luteolus]GGH99368.1 ribonuclease HII [Aquisalinus luteolus]
MAERAPKIRPTFDIERKLPGLVCGIDEAGRGPWAGPVVAAAVILNPDCTPAGICDSKMLSPTRRTELAHALWKTARIGVGIATVEEIDRINIAQATMLAMARAAATLPVPPTTAIVDGNMKPKLACPAYTVIKGDAKSLSIAAASIIAKVTRDRMMLELARAWPWYGWESNKGYCAPVHRAGLERHGVTPHHRRSFAPVRACLEERSEFALPLSLQPAA